MNTIASRIRRVEQRIGPPAMADDIDWPALIAHVAKHGRRLVKIEPQR